MNATAEPMVFRPSLLKSQRDERTRLFPHNAAPIISEGRLIADHTMPDRDWSAFDKPAFLRMTSRRVRNVVPLKFGSIARQAG